MWKRDLYKKVKCVHTHTHTHTTYAESERWYQKDRLSIATYCNSQGDFKRATVRRGESGSARRFKLEGICPHSRVRIQSRSISGKNARGSPILSRAKPFGNDRESVQALPAPRENGFLYRDIDAPRAVRAWLKFHSRVPYVINRFIPIFSV